MKTFANILVLLSVCTSLAQLPERLITPIDQNNTFDEYAGSIFINQNFKAALVIDERTGTYDADLRYNIYSDAIEFAKDDQLFELEKNSVMHFKINDELYYYCKFKNDRGLNRHGYYILVSLSNNYTIYKKIELDITAPKTTSVVESHNAQGRILKREVYYIEKDKKITELPQNKKDILSTVFSDQEVALKAFIKTEKIKIRKEQDLIKLVQKYNSLNGDDSSNSSRSLLSNMGQNN